MFHHSSFSTKSFSPQSWRFDDVGAYEVAVIHGGGYDFLDHEWHKKRIKSKAREIIAKAAKKAVKKAQEGRYEAHGKAFAAQQIAELRDALDRGEIEWNRFYAALLSKQIEQQLTERIRIALMQLGIYQRIEEEDEQAILMLLLEL